MKPEDLEILNAVQLDQAAVLVCYGVDPLLIEIYRRDLPYLRSIIVIETESEVFKNLRQEPWVQKLESDSRFSWIIAHSLASIQSQLKTEFFKNLAGLKFLKFVTSSERLKSQERFLQAFLPLLMETRDHCDRSAGTSIDDSFLGFKSTLDNSKTIFSSGALESLFAKGRDCVVVSVAAGPSLNDHWEYLRAYQDRLIIIAVDTVLKPMLDRGIEPDFVTAIERVSIVTDFFRGLKIPQRTSLVAPSLVLPETFEAFQGRRFVYGPAAPYREALGLGFLPVLSAGSSAGNLNLALAKALGASKVILVGHNLAFAENSHESHVKGTIDPAREKSRSQRDVQALANGGLVVSQDGQTQVYTTADWNLFRFQIENLISDNPEAIYINTALRGAKIRGAQGITFEASLKEFGILSQAACPPNLRQDVELAGKPRANAQSFFAVHKRRRRELVESLSHLHSRLEETLKQDMKVVGDSGDVSQLKLAPVVREIFCHDDAFRQVMKFIIYPRLIEYERALLEANFTQSRHSNSRCPRQWDLTRCFVADLMLWTMQVIGVLESNSLDEAVLQIAQE